MNRANQFIAEVSSFLMDKLLVTQDLYEEIMGKEKNMSHFKGGDIPVENVKWSEAVEFCNRLSDKTGLKPVYTIDGKKVTADWDAKGFRLPTEAEWIYACQAGKMGDRYGEINQIAWYKDNSDGKTHKVGIKKENPWGLYDMLGNVCEWCWDLYGPYPKGDKKVWRGHKSGTHRVTPGGSWVHSEEYCTCTKRNKGFLDFSAAHLGFRLARSL
jgi:formylglycine-generating enzyme required for sulfatase activity